MKHARWTYLLLASLTLVACGDHHTASAPPSSGTPAPPTDFASFVISQVQTQPTLSGASPQATDSLTNDLGLGEASAFSSVMFGTGDGVPSTNNQAVVACTQAGSTACDPSTSADLNSTLN